MKAKVYKVLANVCAAINMVGEVALLAIAVLNGYWWVALLTPAFSISYVLLLAKFEKLKAEEEIKEMEDYTNKLKRLNSVLMGDED